MAGTLGARRPELAARLRAEPSSDVRAALVESLDRLDDGSRASLELVDRLLRQEPRAETRYHMARYLAHHAEQYPPAGDALARLALTDRSDRVRRFAARHAWGSRPGP